MIERARRFAERTALVDGDGAHTYADLIALSERRAHGLLEGRADLDGERIAYRLPPGLDHVATQWAIWRAGGIAVPLATNYPEPEVRRIVADCRAARLLTEAVVRGLDGASAEEPGSLPAVEASRPAMMVYTSGTSGRPKGVVTTRANIEAQITTLVDAWEWAPDDRILHVLPLHHIHGIINALSCALWAGACCEFALPDAVAVWERWSAGGVTLFMAVPTVYRRLIEEWEKADPGLQERWSTGAAGLRLLVSGSAALPVETLERWEAITGQRLLERYGMTEVGMALGNPLHGERRAGTVGQPFDGVEARIVGDDGATVRRGEQGEIEIRGPQVFAEYWERPDETRAAFRSEGWFRTADEGVVEDGYWRIVGRRGIDIIKTGGYKVSGLEIEACMRTYSGITEVAVVGVDDPDWGERVCAAVVATPGIELSLNDLRAWCKEQLAPYKVPKQLVVTDRLPRNAMGKVLKAELRAIFTDGGS